MSQSGTSRAFVVGAVSNLLGSKADAESVFEVLCDSEFGLCSKEGSVCLPECESFAVFLTEFRKFLNLWKQGDQIIFYFSGHGHPKRNSYHLQMGRSEDENASFTLIREELVDHNINRAVIILDACNSGYATKGGSAEDEIERVIQKSDLPVGIAILTSSTEYQKSHETKDDAGLHQSIFTRLLVRAIKTGLDNKPTIDGYLAVEDLQEYIKDQINSDSALKLYRQSPRLAIINGEARIRVAKNKSGKSAAPASAPEELPLSVREYLERSIGNTANLDVIGINPNQPIRMPIEEAFIPLRLDVKRSFVEESFAKNRPVDPNKTVTIESVFKEFNLNGAILLGEPGAGKSTLARKMFWMIAAWLIGSNKEYSPEAMGLGKRTIPVLLHLNQYKSEDELILELLERETKNRLGPTYTRSIIEDLVNQPSLLWILDGLDEIADSKTRLQACKHIREICSSRKNDYVIVTCRYSAYSNDIPLGSEFPPARILPLSQEQVEKFINSWYKAKYAQEKEDVEKSAKEATQSLLEILKTNKSRSHKIQEIASNPQLLSVLCVLHYKDNHYLPSHLMDLYERCVEVMLRSRWSPEGQDPKRFINIAQKALAELAWTMHMEINRRTLPATEAVGICARSLTTVSEVEKQGLDGPGFFAVLKDKCELLTDESDGSCKFSHLTFQEYFAAKYALQTDQARPMANLLGEPWWKEVTLLALSEAPQSFVNAYFHEVLTRTDLKGHIEFFQSCIEEVRDARRDPYGPLVEALVAPHMEHERMTTLLQILRNHQDPTLIELATGFVWDKNPQIAEVAREIIQRAVRDRLTDSAIVTIKESNSGFERALAAWTLRAVPEQLPASEWVTVLQDPDSRVRAVAVEAVGYLGEAGLTAGQELLRIVQHDDDYRVRAVAREAVRRLGVNNIPDAERILPQYSGEDETINMIGAASGPFQFFMDTRTNVKFAHIPGGTFVMGSLEAPDEQPLRDVSVSPFWLSRYVITNEEYQLFLRENPNHKPPFYWNDRRFNQPEQPVVGVTWHDAVAYCAWAGYRLPREAEWEYACRAGTTTRYSFGDSDDPILDYAWISKNSEERTHRVGTKKPNNWGLYDMHGNVWEWCADWYGPRYEAEKTADPDGPATGEMRVLRGGTFFYGATYCRCARREKNFPERRSYDFGFRVVLDCDTHQSISKSV